MLPMDRQAVLVHGQRGRPADAAAGAGDDGGLVRQLRAKLGDHAARPI